MSYNFDRNLGRLIEAGSQPLAFLADRSNMSLSDTFMLLCREFEEAYDKEAITLEGAEIRFQSSLAEVGLRQNTDQNSPYPYYPRFKLEVKQETLTQERVEEIHKFLLDHFPAGEAQSMVTVSQVMNKNGYSKERFGFSKMTNLYLALSTFITVVDTVVNGVPSKDVIIAPLGAPVEPEIQATVPYSFSSAFGELVDASGASIAAFSRECRKDAAATFELLSDAFLEAYSQGAIREEGAALQFNLDKYTITLVTNSLEGSPYPYYMRFATQTEEVAETEALTLEDEKEIYRLLTKTFPSGEEVHIAEVNIVLNDAGFSKERFGFDKTQDMLETFRFVTIDVQTIKGAQTVFVKIHRYSEWDREIALQTDQGAKDGFHLPEHLNQWNVNLSNTTLSHINQLICGVKEVPPKSVIDAICDAYEKVQKPDKLFAVDETFRFETGLQSRDGEDIAATIKASDRKNVNWYLNWGGLSAKMAPSVKPGSELEQYAYLGPWQEFLEKLAQISLPEKWSFMNASSGDYSILRQYIKFTYHRLKLEDKILENAEKTFSAFNTGLVDRHYEAIYACFERQYLPGKQEWRFSDFCVAGERGLGKVLVDCFGNEPPQVASYFEKKDKEDVSEKLLFDVDKTIFPDYHHMLVDNVDRLPLEFLSWELRGDAIEALLKELKETPVSQREKLYQQLRQMLVEDQFLYNRLKNRLDDAIDLAIKRTRWNYKTAIPCYYPSRRKMSFMLPLSLIRDDTADIAMVVEKTTSGTYQGQTILTLQAAYIDARLICRPDSDWLRSSEIHAGEMDDED